MKVCFEITKSDHCGCDDKPQGRIIPHVGPFTESAGDVTKTPQYRKFPLLGDVLMAVTMNSVQQFSCSITITDKKGKPAPVDGVPEWLTTNTDILALTPGDDGMSCDIVAVGIPGTATVQVTADADLGSGVVPIVGTIDVEVTPAPATTIVMTPGTVEDQPD